MINCSDESDNEYSNNKSEEINGKVKPQKKDENRIGGRELSHISDDLDKIIIHILEMMNSNQYIDENDSYLSTMDEHLFVLQSVIHDIKIKLLLESDVMKKLNCLRGLFNQNKVKQGLVINFFVLII